MPRARKRRRGKAAIAFVVTCEHGGNRVPARYRAFFRGRARALASHRGWDPGALELARNLARTLDAPLIATTVTRLLVDCNRSIGNPTLFSELTRDLDELERERILQRYYRPHRRAVESAVRRAMRGNRRVIHLGVHTFTPVLGGARRRADIGLLYDPRRRFEVAVTDALLVHLRRGASSLRVRRNYPYRGWTDGLTTMLRRQFPASRYAGIELEVNQGLVGPGRKAWLRVSRSIAEFLGAAQSPG